MESHEDCIVFLLAKAYQKAYGNLKRKLTPYGLTPIQYLIIETLQKEERLSAGEIGKRLVLDNATLSGVLERLAERGWITKTADAKDKRLLRVSLTKKARALKDELTQERRKANDEILQSLSFEEKLQFKRLLRDIRA